MSEPILGEIRMFPYTFAPRDWAYCRGQLISVAQNPALFAIIGSTYGGDWRSTMGLPNMMGRAPLHVGGDSGQGPGLSPHRLGVLSGIGSCTLAESELPPHTHGLKATTQQGSTNDPAGMGTGRHKDDNLGKVYYNLPASEQPDSPFNPEAVGPAGDGQGQSHENRQPFLTVPFCIALYGVYPSRD